MQEVTVQEQRLYEINWKRHIRKGANKSLEQKETIANHHKYCNTQEFIYIVYL